MKVAIIWLLSFLSQPYLSHSVRCHPEDKQVLLKIKAAFGNPNHLTSWIPNTDCCNWKVVECDEDTNRINQIHLFNANISGQIPEAIAELPHLKALTLNKLTNLTGTIPRALTKLTRLVWLYISWTNISGPIPSYLGELKTLINLDLSFNKLSGSVPPSLAQLTNLNGLRLDRNQLTGSIPEWVGRFSYIYLSHNQFSGTVPRSWGNLDPKIIQLQYNKLEGDISFLFGKNKSFSTVNASRNMLQFDMSNLEFPDTSSVDLNHNMITGSLPESLASLYSIFLNVSYNRLCGKIPVGAMLQELEYTAFFHNRCLCGAPLPNACK